MSTEAVNIFSVKLATDVQPKLSVDLNGRYVKWGAKNDYPERLLFWRNNQAEHGAIIEGKARYIAGLGIHTEVETEQTKAFLAKANQFESWHSLIQKLADDEVTCGGYFLQTITNILGVPVQHFHLSFAKCRISECGDYVLYSECGKWKHGEFVTIPIWKGSGVGTFVDVYKRYSTSLTKLDGVYPKPEYTSCTLDIDTDVRVTTFFNNLVRNNFNPGAIVTIRNGETDEAKKKKISDKIKGEHSGEDEVANAIVIFAPKEAATTEVITLNGNDLDKQYQEVGKRNLQKMLSGHGVHGLLFKIREENSNWGRTDIVEKHEQFINEYARLKQLVYKKLLNNRFKLTYNAEQEFKFEQVKTVGLELPLDNQNVITAIGQEAYKEYIIEKFGIKIPEALDANGQVIETSATVNDNMKGLSAAENADVLRIVRDFQKGRSGMTEAMAISRIASYGVTEQEAKKWLGIQQVQQSKHNKLFDILDKYAHDINFDDEIVDIQHVQLGGIREVVKFETAAQEFAKLRDSVLNQMKGNPGVSKSEIAKILEVSEKQVSAVVKTLVDKKLITSEKDFTPTEKGLNKDTTPKTEIYTEYVYDLREGVSYSGRDNKINDKLLETSHQFCKDIILRYPNKAFSFEAIFAMRNEFGENAWDYGGGVTTKPGGETDSFCNHVWKAITKIRQTAK